jgi:type II secretory pathway component GspD/PulD (secretin)
MKKKKHAMRIFFCIVMCYAILPAQPIQAAQSGPMAVGRENPFAKISRPARPQAPVSLLTSLVSGEERPELSIATVKLKTLDAKTLSSAIEGMCSPHGSVSADTKNNSLVICDRSEILARILAEVDRADGTAPEQMFVETANLKFLDAESLMASLQRMLSPYGSVTVNKSTNSLIISDTRENLSRILSEIERADKTPRQIMVEVVIVDVQLSDGTEMGINWDLLSTTNYDIGYRQNFTTRVGSTVADDGSIGNATAFNTTGIGGDLSVISGTIRNVLAMLQQKRNVEILASPRAMMVSGQSASIKAVEEIPYSEVSDTAAGGAGALTSTEFKDVGITLEVTGTITDGNNIFLTLNAQQSVQTGESITGVPVVDARQVDTSLMLKDGQIVVMGGLRRQEKTMQVNQIPILGDIPLLGLLFKYTNTVVNNTELIVFVSPHIYREGEPIAEDAMAKFKEIKDKPMLLLPEEAKLKESHDKFEQRVEQQTTAIEQLQLEIAESERAEAELRESRARLEKNIEGQASTNEQLQQDLAKCKQAEDELRERRDQIERRIEQQSAANEQLQSQNRQGKQEEGELSEHRNQLKQRLEEQKAAVEQLQLEITKRRQSERDVTKRILLDRIRVLQTRNDEEAVKELLSTLHSLDKILGQEIREALDSSAKNLADSGK